MSTEIQADHEQQLSWAELYRQGFGPILFILCFAIWQHAASSMLAATTLPRAVSEIGGAHLMGWAYSLFQLGSILAGTLAASLVSKYDIRNPLMLAGLLYGLGCLLSALAPQIEIFLMGRLIQGMGGGWMLGLVFIAINRFFPGPVIPKIIALISVVWSASAFSGPLVGGAFANLGLWRYAYGSFTIQSLIFMIATYYIIPQKPRDITRDSLATIDRVSLSRLALMALVILMISVAGADVHPVYSPLMIFAGLGLLYLCFQLDRLDLTSRMFPANTLKPGHTVGAGLSMILVLGMSTMSFLVYGPALLEAIFGVSPLGAGYIVALESVAWGGAAMVFSNSRKTTEPILFRCGSALILIGTLGMALSMSGNLPGASTQGPLWPIIISAILHGTGFGMMWGFIMRRILDKTPQSERDRTSTTIPVIHQIGMAIGAAISNVIANGAGYSASLTITQAQGVALWVFAAFIPLLLIGNLLAWRFARIKG